MEGTPEEQKMKQKAKYLSGNKENPQSSGKKRKIAADDNFGISLTYFMQNTMIC